MTMPIFTKKTIKRKDMYQTVIDIALNAGWEVHTVGNGHVFHTMGSDGATKMEFELVPYDQLIGNPANDIRTSVWPNPGFRLIKNFNKVSKTFEPISSVTTSTPYFHLPFAYCSYSYSTGASYAIDPDVVMDLYYYATKDVIICLNIYPSYVHSNLSLNSLWLLGKPSENFIEEDTLGNYSGMVYAASSASLGNPTTGFVITIERPKNFVKGNVFIIEDTVLPKMIRTPGVDGTFPLVDMLFGRSDHGYRGRLSYFYVTGIGGAADGDILNVTTELGIEKYVKLSVQYSASSAYQSMFPSNDHCIIIRIE